MAPIKKNWQFVLGLILSISFFSLLFKQPFFSHHFNDSLIRMFEIDRCIKDSQIPCRWAPDLGNTHGSPLFNYLPSIPYYFGELFFLLSQSFSFSIKILFGLAIVGIYFFMYVATSRFFNKSKSAFIALIYTVPSFIILASISNNLIGELWGLMCIPLIFLSLNHLYQKPTIKNSLFLSFVVALFLLSSSYYFLGVVLVLLITLFIYVKKKNNTFLIYCLISIIYAFSLSSFFLLPRIIEANLVNKNFLPVSVKGETAEGVGVRYKILTGDSKIINYKEGTNWFRFESNTKDHTIIRLSQYYFPDWKVFVDGSLARLDYENNKQGLMTIFLGKGYHVVEGRFFDTPIRTISNIISISAWTVFLALIISQLKRARGWIGYYLNRIN